ncbi:MAG: type I deoxyribonuclease HsdR [Saprospiraceae bacterium]|nr:MAG: type I deoxyribonuclease HsdR [Saprospiraceae bacterium]
MQVFYRPIDIASLVFFRIVFGILGFADILATWLYYHLEKQAFDPEHFQFYYYGFKWVKVFSEPWMSLFFITLMVASLLITLGKWYRLASWVFALGFTYAYLLEKAHYLNHGYLFCWIALIMAFLPAHRAFSLDAVRKPSLKTDFIPFWCLLPLPLLMAVVYFYGGIAKLNPDWLRAVPLLEWLQYKANLPIIGPLVAWDGTAWFMAYGGLLLDLTVVFFLLFRKTRIWALLAVVFFHFCNFLIFNIGIFPYMSVALTLLFFPPSWPRWTINWFRKKIPWLEKKIPAVPEPVLSEANMNFWQNDRKWRPFITSGLIVLVGLHLLIPLRHLAIPGNVAWTEEGHRYSWRMMLRAKRGSGYFEIKHLPGGETEQIRLDTLLLDKQRRKLFSHPDMILQFAHHLRDEYLAKGEQVEIYAKIKAKLNDGSYQYYIDPEVDLAKVKWSFFQHSDWILPMEEARNEE